MTKSEIITKALGLAMIAQATDLNRDRQAFEAFCQENDLSFDQQENINLSAFYTSVLFISNPKTLDFCAEMRKLYRKYSKKQTKAIKEAMAFFHG